MRIVPLVQAAAFDVAEWEVDSEFGVFPQGARAKDAVFAPVPPPAPVLVGGKRYLFKRSKSWYPDQFWGEVIAYRVGCLMGLSVPPAFAAFNSATGHSAALIEWFYRDGDEQFVLGGEFMQRVRSGFDRARGLQHNLIDIEKLMRALLNAGAVTQNWRQWWAEALLFDALIGNTDRHQDNWGLIFDAVRRRSTTLDTCRLSPLFDNGTSLGHERFPAQVGSWSDARLDKYIGDGKHHVKSALAPAVVIEGHVPLLRYVLEHWQHYIDRESLKARIAFSGTELTDCFSDLQQIHVPVQLSSDRIRFVRRLLLRRHSILNEVLSASA